MNVDKKVTALSNLGKVLSALGEESKWPGFEIGITEEEFSNLSELISRVHIFNGWFENKEVRGALRTWGTSLTESNLKKWLTRYDHEYVSESGKTLGLILAGNIPLVGFHDILCGYLAGMNILYKPSSDDTQLIDAVVSLLCEFDPGANSIKKVTGKLEGFDAVIATGSNNTSKYFERYFGHVPNIIRKNRTSVAVLNGNESKEELHALGKDVFTYYGLGCRNVTKLYLPEGYDLNNLFEAFFDFQYVVDNKKYANNYDYHKAVFLMERYDVIENGFLLVKQDEGIHSPVGTLFYEPYSDLKLLENKLSTMSADIQCRTGVGGMALGQAQSPNLWDYADGVDTLDFLLKI